MKTKDIKGHSEEFLSLMHEVTEELKKVPKIPKSTIQCKSMQEIMDRDPSKDAQHWNRKLDLSKAIATHPSEIQRHIPVDQLLLANDIRKKARNNVGKKIHVNSPSPEKKQSAQEAFRYTEPSKLTRSQVEMLSKFSPIVELKSVPKTEKKSVIKRIKNYFTQSTGNHFSRMTQEEQIAWSKIIKEKK